jgi:hypothetical protein
MRQANDRQHNQPKAARMHRIVLLAGSALFWLVAACGSATATPTVTPPPTTVATVGTAVATVVVPTPSADKAVITGVLKTNPNQPQPAPGVILYLADILPESKGTPFLASFDRVHSVRTVTDPNGRFVFAEVSPASYSLVLDRIAQAYLLSDPKKPGGDFIFTANGGKSLDLGDLVYAVLPGSDSTP